MQSVQILHGRKKTRGELRLPQLHFIVMDQWEKEIGQKAIWGWLKLYTLADRKNYDMDLIPNSMENIRKILGVGGSTFYPQIIKPLWNYGFIDLQEVTLENGNTFVNIIVFEYPGNDPARATQPLEKLRDYDTDYYSTKREKALKGVKRKKKKLGSTDTVERGGSTNTVEGVLPSGENGSTDTVDNNVLNQSNVLEMTNETNVSQSVNESKINSQAIKLMISKSKKLTDRLTDIEKVYLAVKDQPGYSDALYISTLEKAAKARIRVPFFQYLIKAMINNLNELLEQRPMVQVDKPMKKHEGLPEWIVRQMENQEVAAAQEELDPEKKREAEELLRLLGELGDNGEGKF